MNKRFLVFSGMEYYPNRGMEDYVGSASTVEECRSLMAIFWNSDGDGVYRWGQIYDQHLRRAFTWDDWTNIGSSEPDKTKIFPKME